MAIIQTIPLGKKYGSMTSSEAQAGTNTESQLISAKVLNDQIDEKISDIGLATVATSGSYNDLNDKPATPTIPTVNNAVLTIQQNGKNVKTFSANASANVTANITVPTKTSQLSNDSDYATSADVADSLQEAKNYVGITTSNFVTTDTTQTIIGTKTFSKTIVGNLSGNATTATKATQDASGNVIVTTYATKNELSGKQNKLTTTQLNAVNSDITSAKVKTYDNYATEISAKANASDLVLTNTNLGAHTNNSAIHVTSTERSNWNAKSNFSGSYTDLTNKPTIPTVNNGTLTIQKNGTTVKTFSANASANTTANITVPTKVSDLTNDNGFINNTDNCVHLTGNESIDGRKYFDSTGGYYSLVNRESSYATGDTPTSNVYKAYPFVDKNNANLGILQYASRTTGVRDLSLYIYTNDGSTAYGVQINTNREFTPITNNTYSLGTSSKSWNSCYATTFYGNFGSFSSKVETPLVRATADLGLILTSKDSTAPTTTNGWNQVQFFDKNMVQLGYFQLASTNGANVYNWVGNKNSDLSIKRKISWNVDADEFSCSPSNTISLGSSSNWWNSCYVTNVNTSGIKTNSNTPLRMIYGSYGAFWRHDGTNLYLMLTNKDDQYGKWTSARPIQVSLSTGVCNINGNAATATKATQDASGNVITNTYVTKTALSSGTNNGGTSTGVGSLILGCVSINDMASAESAAHSNTFLNISGSVIKLASLSMVSSADVFAINRDSTTLPGTWRFLGYSKQQSNSLHTLGLFIRIA